MTAATLGAWALASTPVHAHGGLGSLGVIQDFIFVLTGLAGLVVCAMLAIASNARKPGEATGVGTLLVRGLALAYLLFTVPFVLAIPESVIRWFPGVVSVVVVLLLVKNFSAAGRGRSNADSTGA